MTLTLDIPAAEEQKIAFGAASKGKTVDEFAYDLIADGLRRIDLLERYDSLRAEAIAAFKASGETEESVGEFAEYIVKKVRAERREAREIR